MFQRVPHSFVLLLLSLLVLSGCRSRKEPPPPPEPAPSFLSRPELPSRGIPISDFERLAHWTVESDAGTVQLRKNLSQSMWGRASAEISFTPERPGPRTVKLTPSEPWLIQSQFDTILLWILHDGSVGMRDDYRIRLRYRDGSGTLGDWSIPYSPSPDVQMLHLRVTERIPKPVYVESILWDIPGSASGTQHLYLDSLSIYQEVLTRIPQNIYYVLPFDYAPIFAPKRKNSVMLNFPSSPVAYRPQTRPERSVQTLKRTEEGGYLFEYKSNEMKLGYRILPTAGMPSVGVEVDGKAYSGLWRGATVENVEEVPYLRFARIHENKLMLQYTQGLQFELSLHGKTLQIEMNSLMENISALDLGSLFAVRGNRIQPLRIPLMRIQEDFPWPVFSIKDDQKLFLVSCFPDWWNSLASRYELPEVSDREEGYPLGKMRYESRWRGTRNMFRERIYFTVSQRLQDVLPRPAHPVAMYRKELGNWRVSSDETLPQMNLMSIEPLEKEWEDRILSREPDGEWREHPQKGILIKSSLFDGIPLRRLAEFREKQKSVHLEVPTVAEYPPWRYMDYDVRGVGGATYTQTYAEVGALLQQVEAEWGGGIVSRGGAEWFWSGLVSGIRPEFPLGIQELHPLLPQFAWQNVHPYSQILGLGKLDGFSLPTDTTRNEETLLNRMLAMQVAYGAFGPTPELVDPILKTKAKRIQAMLQPHFAGARVERIAYGDGTSLVEAGEALQADVLKKSRLYIRLDTETEMWVNGDLFADWSVRVDGRTFELPPFGFVIRGNELFVMNSPKNEHNQGLCLLAGPEQIWVSSPDQKVEELGMRIQGCLQVLRKNDGKVQIDIGDWYGEARIEAGVLKLERIGTIRGIDQNGEAVTDIRIKQDGDHWILQSDSRLQRVWISPEISGREMKFSP